MTSDSSRQAHDYSSSGPTALLERCDAILNLGNKLTKELGIDHRVETLERWMAHYIAELIQETEKASDKDRPAKMQLCFDTILMLWERRYSLPNGSRPFENIEPLMRALESLDPENVTPRYFREVRSAAKGVNESDEAAKWLKYIDSIDYSARILIRQCLDRAAQTAKNNTEDWVSLAEAAGAVNHAESSLVRMIADEKSILIKTDLQKVTKEIIEDRLNHFVRLIEVATLIVIELQEKIQESQPTNDEA